jgi:hypothetical protein
MLPEQGVAKAELDSINCESSAFDERNTLGLLNE